MPIICADVPNRGLGDTFGGTEKQMSYITPSGGWLEDNPIPN